MIPDLILKTLEDGAKEWTPKAHYPSSASVKKDNGEIIGPDMLSQYLKWTGVKPSNPPNGESLLKMRLGDGTHEVLSKILAKAGIKAVAEVSFKQTVPGLAHQVSGRVDQLIEVDGELEVLEVKSSQDSAMFSPGWGIKYNGAKDDHILQVLCYLACVPGVKRARILYVARDTGRMLEYVIDGPQGQLNWDRIVERWKELEGLLAAKTAPAPEYKAWINEKTGEVQAVKTIGGKKHKTHWRVMYDSYRDLIWKDPSNWKYTYNYENDK